MLKTERLKWSRLMVLKTITSLNAAKGETQSALYLYKEQVKATKGTSTIAEDTYTAAFKAGVKKVYYATSVEGVEKAWAEAKAIIARADLEH